MPRTIPRFDATRIALYCKARLAAHMSPDDLINLRAYLELCLAKRQFPPYRGHGFDAVLLSEQTGIETRILVTVRPHIQPIYDALCRALADRPLGGGNALAQKRTRTTKQARSRNPRPKTTSVDASGKPAKRGPKPRPIIAHPEPLWSEWDDPDDFAAALKLHLDRFGETVGMLARAITASGVRLERLTLDKWVKGTASPRSATSLQALDRIEHRYRLPSGSLRAKLPHPARATIGNALDDCPAAERRRLAWHLPDDFARRPLPEQDEIIAWVRANIISGSTDYRRYQAAAQRQRFAVRFRPLDGAVRWTGKHKTRSPLVLNDNATAGNGATDGDGKADKTVSMVVDAPERLQREMTELLRFKTATLTAFGLRRSGVWNAETASQKIEHLGLMFGALAVSPEGEVRGYGADLASLSFAHLLFPRVWDWYLGWREARRGFYTKWEVDMLSIVLALVQKETGWLRQTPRLAEHLVPIPGLVDDEDITSARTDWNAACDAMHAHSP